MIWTAGFDPQPVLEGENILLRPTVAADWDGLFGVASDPEIWAVHPAHDRWQEPVFRTFFDTAMASGGNLTIIDKNDNQIIGSSRYGHERAGPNEVEIGWTFLARSHWGGSTNRALKTLMIGHALAHHDACLLFVGEHNIRSRRAMEKIGGVLRPGILTLEPGSPAGAHVVYEIRTPLTP